MGGLFFSLDIDKSGTITIDEFADGILRFHGHARSLDLAETRQFVLQGLHEIEKCTALVESLIASNMKLDVSSRIFPLNMPPSFFVQDTLDCQRDRGIVASGE